MKKDVLNAVRAKCLDCCMGQANEVKLCTITDCSLYPYRFGKDPNKNGRTLSEEQKSKLAEANRKYWEEKKASDSESSLKGE